MLALLAMLAAALTTTVVLACVLVAVVVVILERRRAARKVASTRRRTLQRAQYVVTHAECSLHAAQGRASARQHVVSRLGHWTLDTGPGTR